MSTLFIFNVYWESLDSKNVAYLRRMRSAWLQWVTRQDFARLVATAQKTGLTMAQPPTMLTRITKVS